MVTACVTIIESVLHLLHLILPPETAVHVDSKDVWSERKPPSLAGTPCTRHTAIATGPDLNYLAPFFTSSGPTLSPVSALCLVWLPSQNGNVELFQQRQYA